MNRWLTQLSCTCRVYTVCTCNCEPVFQNKPPHFPTTLVLENACIFVFIASAQMIVYERYFVAPCITKVYFLLSGRDCGVLVLGTGTVLHQSVFWPGTHCLEPGQNCVCACMCVCVCIYAYMHACKVAVYMECFTVCWELYVYFQILILIGRALNIFPLTALMNCCRSVKISLRMQCIMWYSGKRFSPFLPSLLSHTAVGSFCKYCCVPMHCKKRVTLCVVRGLHCM